MNDKNVTERLAANEAGIARAAALLRAGALVALPTETVYGLGARADSAESAAAIYAAKGRPAHNPLIVHVADLAAAERLAVFSPQARALARAFWPGGLTLVLPKKPGAALAPQISAGLPTIALRVPAHEVMCDVLARLGLPVAAPSANISGYISPTRSEHVLASLDGRIGAVLDGGPSEAGLESTIVALRGDGGWEVLRPGPVSYADIADVIGANATDTKEAAGAEEAHSTEEAREPHIIEAPGQLLSHYSPGKPIRLNAAEAKPDEFMIGFGALAGDYNLSPTGDLREAAARLYAALHHGAASDKPRIAVAALPAGGISAAIHDRLGRAAAASDKPY